MALIVRKFLSCLLLLCSTLAVAASNEQDVARYIDIFKGNDATQHNNAVESLAWMGLSDARLFDVIEQRLLAEHEAVIRDRDEKNRVARYIRALGFSGNAKYLPTISRFVGDRTYDRYARTALQDHPNYSRWNSIISDRSTFDPTLNDEANRVINMLRADDFLLKRIGAKRVYFKNREPQVLAVLEAQLLASHTIQDKDASDAIAWMAKALGETGDQRYIPLLQQASNAPDGRVARYANEALRKLAP